MNLNIAIDMIIAGDCYGKLLAIDIEIAIAIAIAVVVIFVGVCMIYW